MLRDRSLIPSEAIRLAALGELAIAPRRYGELADEVRAFTGRIVGLSLDLIGPPIELLKVEGLIETEGGTGGAQAMMRIAPAGRDELARLMTAAVRPGINDLSKLVIALKLRFLPLLNEADRQRQIGVIAEFTEQELVRLSDLRRPVGVEVGPIDGWLALEIHQAQERLAWLRQL